ncbi:MAG: helix-turn-helix transcriptional regulator [Thermomicrobiales bacterium]
MYHPTTRVLTVLEILQARGGASGADLATRLEVDTRTIRNYITMLREMGIPVEAQSGRHGGYRLRPGFRLPPLMLDNDEALAVTLGLLFARRSGLMGAAPATEGALAKIERVLPEALRAQVRALAEILVLDRPTPRSPDRPRPPIPSPTTLLALATAAIEQRRLTLTYHGWEGATTIRSFDPYAVVYLTNAAWYTVGYCHLRGGVRVFRLDRVMLVKPEGTSFVRPTDFDCLAYVQRSLALLPVRWSAEIVLDTSLAEAQRWVAPLFAVVTEENGEVILRCTATDIDWLAHAFIGLPFAFRVRTPPELLDAMGRLHVRIGRAIADSSSPKTVNGDA